MDKLNSLIWSPIAGVLEQQINCGNKLILLIAPFIKTDALQRLCEIKKSSLKLKIVCRWRPEDIISGTSDLDVYEHLKKLDSKLYLNPNIHLKLYVFDTNVAFNTSGNITLRGLGYSKKANIEAGSFVALTELDWAQIYRIIDTSHLVDDALYDNFKTFLNLQPKSQPLMYPPDLFPVAKKYTISSLPATDNPVRLLDYYFSPLAGDFTPEEVRCAVHDLVLFAVPRGITRDDFQRRLEEAFRTSPFVQDFVELLKQEQSLRFGAVNEWIHQKCEDVPLPYRWEIKENTHIFYNWLVYFIPEISWDRPNYSQVIYWNAKK